MNKGNSHKKQNDPVTLTYHWGELWHPKTKKWAKNHMTRLYRRKKNMELKEVA